MLFNKIGRRYLEKLDETYEYIRSVRDPRKRRGFVDSFYTEFVNEVPFRISDPRTVKPIMRIIALGGEQFRKHVFKAGNALTGTAFFADGKRTRKKIADLERKRYANMTFYSTVPMPA